MHVMSPALVGFNNPFHLIFHNPNNPWANFYLSACLAHLGRLDEAGAAVGSGLAVNPKFSIKRLRAFGESDNAVFLAQRERMIDAMRTAGAPDV
jgi:hypothetical protein